MLRVIFMSYYKQLLFLITDMHFGLLLWCIKSIFLLNSALSDPKILQHFIAFST